MRRVISGDIVIACEHDGAVFPRPSQAVYGVRPVADHVAQAPDRVTFAGIGDHGVQGLFIRMDVRQNQNRVMIRSLAQKSASGAIGDILCEIVNERSARIDGHVTGAGGHGNQNMSPEERVEAIREVAEQAMDLMTDEERLMLAEMMLTKLINPMSNAEREQLMTRLVPTAALAVGD